MLFNLIDMKVLLHSRYSLCLLSQLGEQLLLYGSATVFMDSSAV